MKSLQPPTCVKWSGTTTWLGLLQGCFALKLLRKCAPLKHGSLRNKTYQDLMDVIKHTANSSSNSCWRRRRWCCVGGGCVSHVASTRGWSAPLHSKIWAAHHWRASLGLPLPRKPSRRTGGAGAVSKRIGGTMLIPTPMLALQHSRCRSRLGNTRGKAHAYGLCGLQA